MSSHTEFDTFMLGVAAGLALGIVTVTTIVAIVN